MNHLTSLFLSQSYKDTWDDYCRSLSLENFPKWDYIILTASDENQAEGYRSQIASRKEYCLLRKVSYSSLAYSCGQISCSHENLPAWICEGSGISWAKMSCEAAESAESAILRMARVNSNTKWTVMEVTVHSPYSAKFDLQAICCEACCCERSEQ